MPLLAFPASPGPRRFAMPSRIPRIWASSAPANSTTNARIGPCTVHAPCGRPAGQSKGLAGRDPALLVADEHEPAALDDDEPGGVRVVVRLDPAALPECQLG